MDTQKQLRQIANEGTAASISARKSGRFYIGPSRRSVLKELWFGLSGGEVGLLTGEAGLGKTLLCRELLRRLPAAVRSVYTVAPLATREGGGCDLIDNIEQSVAMMRAVHDQSDPTAIPRQDPASHLAIIVDEAHRLDAEAFRRLAEWRHRETNEGRSIGLLLIGPPSLRRMLALPELEQFALQLTTRCELPVFLQDETQSYIEHWLASSMRARVELSEAANRMAYYATAGVPSEINQVCRNVVGSVDLRRNPAVTALEMARAIWKTLKLNAGEDFDIAESRRQSIDRTTLVVPASDSYPDESFFPEQD